MHARTCLPGYHEHKESSDERSPKDVRLGAVSSGEAEKMLVQLQLQLEVIMTT